MAAEMDDDAMLAGATGDWNNPGSGSVAAAEAAVAAGADACRVDGNGFTPLHCAAFNGHAELAVWLAQGPGAATVAAADGYSGVQPLHFACESGSVAVARCLLSCDGVDVQARTNSGWTPLHYAAYGGHVEVVRLLLEEAGADIDAVNRSGETALAVATLYGKHDVVAFLSVEWPRLLSLRTAVALWGDGRRSRRQLLSCRGGAKLRVFAQLPRGAFVEFMHQL